MFYKVNESSYEFKNSSIGGAPQILKSMNIYQVKNLVFCGRTGWIVNRTYIYLAGGLLIMVREICGY